MLYEQNEAIQHNKNTPKYSVCYLLSIYLNMSFIYYTLSCRNQNIWFKMSHALKFFASGLS